MPRSDCCSASRPRVGSSFRVWAGRGADGPASGRVALRTRRRARKATSEPPPTIDPEIIGVSLSLARMALGVCRSSAERASASDSVALHAARIGGGLEHGAFRGRLAGSRRGGLPTMAHRSAGDARAGPAPFASPRGSGPPAPQGRAAGRVGRTSSRPVPPAQLSPPRLPSGAARSPCSMPFMPSAARSPGPRGQLRLGLALALLAHLAVIGGSGAALIGPTRAAVSAGPACICIRWLSGPWSPPSPP
jgi:hypothetical protein